jgi:hypothetical protein
VTEGIIVFSVQAEKRRARVKEISFCFASPDLPLREDLTLREVIPHTAPDYRTSVGWLTSLSIPSFPPGIRLINLSSLSELPLYTRQLFLLRNQLPDNPEYAPIDFSIVKLSALRAFVRPFLLDNKGFPTAYASLSLLSTNILPFDILLHGGRIIGGLYTVSTCPVVNPFANIPPSARPETFIYCSIPLLSSNSPPRPLPAHSSSPVDDYLWVSWLVLRFTYPNNVRLVGFAEEVAS